MFLFGEKKDANNLSVNAVPFFEILEEYKERALTVNELFSDLPPLIDGETNNNYYGDPKHGMLSKFYRRECLGLSLNISRKHNDRDKEIYKIAVEKKKSGQQLKYFDLPDNLRTHKNTTSFIDRYKVIDGGGNSHTVVSHIAKDGHYYIHPDTEQNRSITVREAARIQGFPDNFIFENSRTSAFKQIGNAVPPYFSNKLARALIDKMNS